MIKKISLMCSQNKIFWLNNPFDILKLRNQFRLIGNLVKVPILNNQNNLFLFLDTEEVILGLETGFLKPKFIRRKNRLLYFLLKKIEKSLNILGKNYEINLNLKRRYHLVKKWREASEIIIKNCKPRSKKISLLIFEQNSFLNSNKFLFKIKTRPKSTINLSNLLNKFSENDFLKYSIFKNLWQRGFCLYCGVKFGCSFLAYAGNITDVHSYLSIFVVPIQRVQISPKFIIAFGRLGTITKKFNIIVYLNKVCVPRFISLRWHNFLP